MFKIKLNIYKKMGICESKKKINSDNIPKISIEPNDGNNFEYDKNIETVFPGSGKPIPKEKLKIIKNQREKSICKIIKNDKAIGTGFLCYVEELKKIKTLITAFHVLG